MGVNGLLTILPRRNRFRPGVLPIGDVRGGDAGRGSMFGWIRLQRSAVGNWWICQLNPGVIASLYAKRLRSRIFMNVVQQRVQRRFGEGMTEFSP